MKPGYQNKRSRSHIRESHDSLKVSHEAIESALEQQNETTAVIILFISFIRVEFWVYFGVSSLKFKSLSIYALREKKLRRRHLLFALLDSISIGLLPHLQPIPAGRQKLTPWRNFTEWVWGREVCLRVRTSPFPSAPPYQLCPQSRAWALWSDGRTHADMWNICRGTGGNVDGRRWEL